MFGYIVINKDELKIKDYNLYQSLYCGLCQQLKEQYGKSGQLSLSYDMTFLVLLHTALYEADFQKSMQKCIAHPFEKHPTSRNQYTSYAADMNLLLTYYKCLDDWDDDKKLNRYTYAQVLKKKILHLQEQYPAKCQILAANLSLLRECENRGETDLDLMAGYFGDIMAELFVYQEDEWAKELRTMGFFFGKFIYLMDAYEDLEKDEKSHSFNPFFPIWHEPDFEDNVKKILTMMMAECSKAFERLPILEHVDILRNILYSGVWTRFEMIRQKRKDQNHDKSI